MAASGERVSVYEKGDNFEFFDRVRRALGGCVCFKGPARKRVVYLVID